MLLKEMFSHLSTGEFSMFSLSNNESNNEISPKDYITIINHVNLGMLDLYRKFPVKTRELVLQEVEGLHIYKLHTDFAQSNTVSAEINKYIQDSIENPFSNDILAINTVLDADAKEVMFNTSKEYSMYSEEDAPTKEVMQVSHDTIKIITPVSGALKTIEYKALPVKIDSAILDIEGVEIDLPEILTEPLLFYVIGRHLMNKGTPEYTNLGQNYMNKYAQYCEELRRSGMLKEQEYINNKFDERGWV